MMKNINKFSKDPYVSGVLVLLAVFNILAYLNEKSLLCLGVFLLTLCIVNIYSENLSYGILISLFVSNIVFGGCRIKKELF